jgi:hypothetical protein
MFFVALANATGYKKRETKKHASIARSVFFRVSIFGINLFVAFANATGYKKLT